MLDFMTAVRGRFATRDVVIAVVLSLAGLEMIYENVQDDEIEASLLAMPLFLAVTVPVLWRRAAPLAAAVAVLAGLLVHIALFGELFRCGVAFVVILVLAFSAAAELERRQALVALAVGIAGVLAVVLTDHELGADLTYFPQVALLTAAIWGIGRIVRSRRRLAGELRTRTSELRKARDERARLEVETDRARLSRELDELLQRRLGELARLADHGARPSDPAAATAILVDIERESRRTLEEMRALVGVLRPDAFDVPTAPQPTLTHLEALLMSAKGADARLTVEGSPRVLPAAVELSAYRIVEHLLAALEDAPGVEVRVRFADDALSLAVSGPARRRSKAAIERARERVQLHRGTLHATTRGGRAEAVASLPVLAGA